MFCPQFAGAKAHRDNQLTQTHHLIYSAQINTHDILESVRIGVYLEACHDCMATSDRSGAVSAHTKTVSTNMLPAQEELRRQSSNHAKD